jgi:DNA-binding PadR family transcriptional regulator
MAQPKSRDLFPGALEMMVLRLVQHEPLHGYALVQRIRQVSNDMVQVGEGSLYPALQRLLEGIRTLSMPVSNLLMVRGFWR